MIDSLLLSGKYQLKASGDLDPEALSVSSAEVLTNSALPRVVHTYSDSEILLKQESIVMVLI